MKEECKNQGLPVSGTKAVLIQRLTDNAGSAKTEATEETMEVETKTAKSTSLKRKAEEEQTESAPVAKKEKKVFVSLVPLCF